MSTSFLPTPPSNRETRICKRCNGEGETRAAAFSHEGKVYPARTDKCWACKCVGHFEEPDFDLILSKIRGRKGLCSKRPGDGRAYYVWRMARFHGGVDVTMPMGAMSEVSGDPFTKELDVFTDWVAKHVFGTHMAAAVRWGRLLTNNVTPELLKKIGNLPASAYECGPVVLDGNKPEEEALELR